MSDSSSQPIEQSTNNDEYNRPDQFCFGVEDFDGTAFVTICPIEYFQKNGYQDDQYYDDIARKLEEHKFFAVMEASFENEDKSMTIEQARAKMLELGFKQLPEYDKYIETTASEYPIYTNNYGPESYGPESEADPISIENMEISPEESEDGGNER